MRYLLDGLEKTAAPMFGKKRYKPRDHNEGHWRRENEMRLHEFKRESNDPTFNEEDMENMRKAHRIADKSYNRESSKEVNAIMSSILAADMLRRGGLKLLDGNKDAAKRYAAVAGLASAYPAARGLGNLKKRYHFTKQENIDKDMAERAIDRQVEDRTTNYIKSQKSSEDGWHANRHNAPKFMMDALREEAKTKNARLRFNPDYSVTLVDKKGKESKKRWPLKEGENE